MSQEPKPLFSGDEEIAELQEGFMILSQAALENLPFYTNQGNRLRALRKKIEDRRADIPPAAR